METCEQWARIEYLPQNKDSGNEILGIQKEEMKYKKKLQSADTRANAKERFKGRSFKK